MNIQQAYNVWADQYDTNNNKTRDLEAIALREILSKADFNSVLEIGCGTGKNSVWFAEKAGEVLAVDFSDEMLAKARQKVAAGNIGFQQADITKLWDFTTKTFDLASFSLVLEHIEDLDFIFSQLKEKVETGGYVYIGELHPFKQYQGSLARFDTENGRVELQCYTHNVSEFVNTAINNGFTLVSLNEWFDDSDKKQVPRILTLLLKKH